MHAWSATMLAFTARPPDPVSRPRAGASMWLSSGSTHLDPLIHTWLATRPATRYWRHGSVCEDYAAIKAAVLAVGGWADPYRDTVLRLRPASSTRRCAGSSAPGRTSTRTGACRQDRPIGFLQETLRWWDQWLKDEDTGVLAEPLLRDLDERVGAARDPLPRAPGPLGGRGRLALPRRRHDDLLA